MPRLVSSSAAALAAAALAGCLDMEQEFTLNPDGSGKVVLRTVFAPLGVGPILMGGRESQKPEEILRDSVRQFIRGAQGIEAWKDVRYEVRKDGKFQLQATAYFKDLSNVRLLSRGFDGPFMDRFTFTRDGRGDLVLEAVPESGFQIPGRKGMPEDLSEEQIQTRVRMEQAKYEQMRPMMEGTLKELRVKTRLNLPVPAREVSVFRKAGEDAVELEFRGPELLKVMDGLAKDEAFLRDQIRKGSGLLAERPPDQDLLQERLFGQRGPARAVLKGEGRPRFDFEAELTEARKEEPEFRRKLGLDREEGRVEAPFSRERNPEVLLRDAVGLDLVGSEPLLSPVFGDPAFRQHLTQCLAEGGYGYDIHAEGSGSSFSSPQNKGFARLHRAEEGRSEVEFRRGGARLSIAQDPGSGGLTLILVDPGRDLVVLFLRRRNGKSSLMWARGDVSLTFSWKSLEEAFRSEPAALEERLLAPLRDFPLDVRPTPGDPRVVEVCLQPPPGEETIGRVRRCRDRMASDDARVREEASEELGRMAVQDLQALRVIVAMVREERDPEIRGRLQAAAESAKEAARAVAYALDKGLDHDLTYLAGLMGSADPARAGAARARLAALAGREFGTREEFEAWHREQGERLIWDPASGRYRLRE